MKNPFFEKAKKQARKIKDQPEKVKKVLDDAVKRSKLIDSTKEKAVTFREHMETMFQMLRAYFKGEYKAIPQKTLIKLLGAVIYFLFVTDLIPDFIAVIGLVDDAAVVAWVIKSIQGDLENFKIWKQGQTVDIPENSSVEVEN